MPPHVGLGMPVYPAFHDGQSCCLTKVQVSKGTWFFALCLSFLIHGALLISNGGQLGTASKENIDKASVVWLHIAQAKQQPKLETKQEATQPKAEPKKTTKPTPTTQTTPKPKPENKKVEPATTTTQPKSIQDQPLSNAAPQTTHVNSPAIQQGLREQKKQQYLARVLQHIERHKHYPKAAQRRGIEGVVSVSLHIHQDGQFSHIQLGNSPRILRKAIQKTLGRASPLPTPPDELTMPIQLQFNIQFSLQQ